MGIFDWLRGLDRRFINTFAPWLAALGTLTTASLSLWLATRDRQLRLNILARPVLMFQDSVGRWCSASKALAEREGLTGLDSIEITVTNIGRRGVTIDGIYWKLPLLRKPRVLYQVSPHNPLSDTMPAELTEGKKVNLVHPRKDFAKNDWHELANRLWWPSLSTRLIKVGVVTSIGKLVEKRIPREMAQVFLHFIQTAQAQSCENTDAG